jgi:hypothetical protein
MMRSADNNAAIAHVFGAVGDVRSEGHHLPKNTTVAKDEGALIPTIVAAAVLFIGGNVFQAEEFLLAVFE